MKLHRLFTTVMVLALLVSAIATIPASAAPPDRTKLPGSAPSWANSQNFAGAADPAGAVGFRVYLGWKNAGAAEALARAVSDPNSSSYGHYLSAAQFRRQFAPDQGQVNSVQSWLKSQGFSVIYTPGNNHYVSAEGTVAQAQAAFGTAFGMYNVNGKACAHRPPTFPSPARWPVSSPTSSGWMTAPCLSTPTT